MRPVRCGGEAACLDRAMGWVLAPLRNADRADRWAGERARKLVAGPIWAGPVRAGQSAETSFSSGGGGFSWAGLVLHHPRRLASFLRTLATGRTAPCPSPVRQPPAGRRAFAPSCLGSTACPGSMAREVCGAFAAFPSKGGRQGQAAVSGSARHRAGREGPVQHATPNEPPVAETLRDAAASRRRARPKGGASYHLLYLLVRLVSFRRGLLPVELVPAGSELSPGQNAYIVPYLSCGHCAACRKPMPARTSACWAFVATAGWPNTCPCRNRT